MPENQLINLSIITITLNNERTLAKVLQAVSGWANEIIIVDSGSVDNTLKIATQYNCQIFKRDFDGFGKQKGFAVVQAKNDWVMVVDADEILTPEIKQEIEKKLQSPEYQGFMVPISLIFLGKLMRFGSEYKMPHLRLFNKKFGNYNTDEVHEDVELNGKIGKLNNHVLHDSYADLHEYLIKFNNYTTAGAKKLREKDKKVTTFEIIIRFPIAFIKEYFFRLNFLNGYQGFIWALFSAFYPIVKYAKLKEINSLES